MDPIYGHMVPMATQITDAPCNKNALHTWVDRKENLYEM